MGNESTESQSGSTIPPSLTDAEQLDFYRRMYFEYLEMWGTDLHQVIVLASEGRWFDLIEYAGDALNGRDCVEEGDAEVYEIAKVRVKLAEAAPDLLAELRRIVDYWARPSLRLTEWEAEELPKAMILITKAESRGAE